jgi:AmiR/NasT family two-component response regulator
MTASQPASGHGGDSEQTPRTPAAPSVMERLRRDLEEQRIITRQLQHALHSRVVIEQAKGILAERHGATVDEAFEAMRSYARSNQRQLHRVAAEVIGSLSSSRSATDP